MSEEYRKELVESELDLNLLLTNSVWGRQEVSKELKEKLGTLSFLKDKEGRILVDDQNNPVIERESLWGLLSFFTRDLRLGNLNEFNNELETCRYLLDLANDLLTADMIKPFLITLSRVASIIETSQSKKGFLRRQMNTLRQETVSQQIEPQKKGFFGGGNTKGGQPL